MSDTPRVSRSSITASIRPSGVFHIDLPFGEPPPSLIENDKKSRLSEDLLRTIRALTNNAEKIRQRSPLIAAECWHEAGRLLDCRAERLKEAWVCYNRALAVFPDHRPSLAALTRLSRLCGADDILGLLLDAQIERATLTAEKTALYTEAGALCIKLGDLPGARKKLKTAVALSDKAVVPRILLAMIASEAAEVGNSWSMIAPLYTVSFDSRLSRALAQHAAVQEDKRDITLNPSAQPASFPIDKSSLPLLWIQLRTCLRRKQYRAAISVLDDMTALLQDRLLQRALSRLKNTLQRISGEPASTEEFQSKDAFYNFLNALLTEDKDIGIREMTRLRREARSRAFKEALSLFWMIFQWRPNQLNLLSFGPSGVSSPAARAVLRFLKMSSLEDVRNPEVDASLLYLAAVDKNRSEVCSILKRLREETVDADAVWPIKVAETALEFEQLQQSGQNRSSIPLTDSDTHRSPLPSMMRRTERRHRHLSELCLGEARSSDDPRFVASRLSWAGFHLETLDPFDSARLYTEALTCDPSLLFAVKGLERTGTQKRESAVLYQCAAEAARDEQTRAAALLRAGILFIASKDPEEAAALFSEAAELLPKEEGLQRIAFRFALTYPKRVSKSRTARFLEGKAAGIHPTLLGVFSLFTKPEIASRWFKEALLQQPSDPLAKLGVKEALLHEGRASLVSEHLFTALQNASTAAEQGRVYQRLAHIDRFHRNDNSSAALFTELLHNQMPGHRSSLVHLAVYYMAEREAEDFWRVLTALSLTVSDSADAEAMVRLSALGDPSGTELLRRAAAHSQATLLDLTVLEGITEDAKERLSLLEKITDRLPHSCTYMSRLADCMDQDGRQEEALALYKQSIGSCLTVFHNLHRMSCCLRDMNAGALLLDTLVIAADSWTIPVFKAQALSEAARFAYDIVNDPERAVDLCLLALNADPEEEAAFSLADTLLSAQMDNPSQYLRLLETRLKGYCDPMDELVIRIKIFHLLQREGAKENAAARQTHLRAVVALTADNRPIPESDEDESELAAIWDDAVFEAVSEAYLSTGGVLDAAMFSALGHLYLKELNETALAEKYFQQALAVDSEYPDALSGLADILLHKGETASASDLLGRLTAAISDPKEKLEKLLMNAEILRESLHDEKKAEQVLKKARKTAPFALGPVEALADIYEQQKDESALLIHLDSALQSHGAALLETPDMVSLYENIRAISQRKGVRVTASMADDMLALFHAETDRMPKAEWIVRPGSRIADPSFDEHLCPDVVSAGLCNVLKVLEEPLSRMLGVSADQIDVSALEKPKRRDKIAAIAAGLAPIFGAENTVIRMGTTPDLRIAPGPVPVILMPEPVFQSDIPGVKRFAAAAAFQWIRLGLAMTTAVPPLRFRRLLAGLARIFSREYVPKGFSEYQVDRESECIEAFVKGEMLQSLEPFSRDIRDALETPDLDLQTAAVGHRAGLLGAGSLPAAILGLRAISGVPEGPLSYLPGAGSLLSFAFSSDFAGVVSQFEAK